MEYPNFYENLEEAHRRLLNTVVVYDGTPYIVMAITNHRPGEIFSVYLDPLPDGQGKYSNRPSWVDAHGPSHPDLGRRLDEYIDEGNPRGILRKNMNSPSFNKFRPFPLGMCNYNAGKYYLERTPIRPKTEQGLIASSIVETYLSADGEMMKGRYRNVPLYTGAIKATVMNDYPSPKESLEGLLSDEYKNTAMGFHRNFAFVKGPIGMVFLAYKADIIGVLPQGDLSQVRLGKNFGHTREAVAELKVFNQIG